MTVPPPIRRVIIENVAPQVDCGRFAVTRTPGEYLIVTADIFADGHDVIDAALQVRKDGDANWQQFPLKFIANDRWQGQVRLPSIGIYFYTLRGWVDTFNTWARDLRKRADAGQDLAVDLAIGAQHLSSAAKQAAKSEAAKLAAFAKQLLSMAGSDFQAAIEFSQNEDVVALLAPYRDRSHDTVYEKELIVRVDPPQARFSAWYQMFPRSCTTVPNRPGTLRDCANYLDYVADMGFDVLYLPPIHPIGTTERKGKNNSTTPAPEDPGSPWAIGSKDGGHKAINPDLGTLDDLKDLREKAAARGIALALDIAFQCSPDHPYVKEHREWFRSRPDGTVQYAENPPKKYQDIYPLDFESPQYPALAEELKSVILYWISNGIRIFRVDNPHTKPFAFWEWMIKEVKREHPDVIFLAEAFTRPKVMYQLAKLGFNHSYTYFAWKNNKEELTQYFTEISNPPVSEYFRPNVWPNTPDILNEYLQKGGRPAFMARLILAATLSANYGIYGPPFELCVNVPVREGSEEYLDSEKYQVRVWNRDDPASLKNLIRTVNQIRREHLALQSNKNLVFHPTDNPELIVFSKTSDDRTDKIVVAVNLDSVNRQMGWVDLQLKEFRLRQDEPYEMLDLLAAKKYLWNGSRNYIELNPAAMPAHIFLLQTLR